MAKSSQFTWFVVSIALSCVAAMAVGGWLFLETFPWRPYKELRPEVQAMMRVWDTTLIALPDDALDVDPYSDAIKEKVKAYDDLLLEHKSDLEHWSQIYSGDKASVIPGVMDDPDFSLRPEDLEPVISMIKAFLTVLRDDGFAYEAFRSGRPVHISDRHSVWFEPGFPPNFLRYQYTLKATLVYAVALRGAGRISEAFEISMLLANSTKGSSYAHFGARVVGEAVGGTLLQFWSRVLRDDPLGLEMRMMLEHLPVLMENLDDTDRPPFDPAIGTTYHDIEFFRELKRAGVPVQIPPMTGREFTALRHRMIADYLESCMQAYDYSPSDLNGIQEKIDSERLMYRMYSRKYGSPGANFFEDWFELVQENQMRGWELEGLFGDELTLEEPSPRTPYLLVRLDLLGLEIARRLFVVERGRDTTDPTELKKFVGTLNVADRYDFDGAPYRFSDRFYSVGPDGEDGGGKVLFDPYLGGWEQTGDIYLDLEWPAETKAEEAGR